MPGPVLSHLIVSRSYFPFYSALSQNSRSLMLRSAMHPIPRLPAPNSDISLFHNFPAPIQVGMNTFFRSVLGAETRNATAQRGCTPHRPVYLLAKVSEDALFEGTASLSDARTTDNHVLCRRLHSHNLPCDEKLDCVAVPSPAIHQQFKTLPYPEHFFTADDVPEALSSLLTSAFYAWHTRAMPAVGRLRSLHGARSLGPNTFQEVAADGDAEDVVEVPTDDDTTGNQVAGLDSDP